MPFLDDVDEVRGKLPCGRLSRPVLLGIACFAAVIAVLAALGVSSSARGAFEMGNAASSPSAAIEETQPVRESSGSICEEASEGENGNETTHALVYVVGAVKEPGVYELETGSRVNDAINAARGFTKKADRTAVNLARTIVDGEQITIPEKGLESASPQAETDGTTGIGNVEVAGEPTGGKVNINSASAEELESLPGIGEATAQKIIASREAEGPFATSEDLKRVSGIGDKKYEAISELVCV